MGRNGGSKDHVCKEEVAVKSGKADEAAARLEEGWRRAIRKEEPGAEGNWRRMYQHQRELRNSLQLGVGRRP
jgi:hypothetical protein